MTEASTPPDPTGPDSSATRKATRRGRTSSLAHTLNIIRDIEAAREAHRNIHQIEVSHGRLECISSCSGPLPHVSEYRAADVRPSAEATATRKALDAAPE